MISDLGCVVCHEIQGVDTTIKDEAPDLTFEGDKVKEDWLFNFIKNPFDLRPWLKGRMPNFRLTDEETLAITEYIMTLKDKNAVPISDKTKFKGLLPRKNVETGRILSSKDYLDCFMCHQARERKPEGRMEEWGPDLSLATERLNPDWIIKWLQDPQKIQLGTKMPSYFYDAESGPEDILDGDEARQIVVLRDYVISLGKEKTFQSYKEAKAKFPDVNPEWGKRLVADLNCIGCHTIENFPQEVRTNIPKPLRPKGLKKQ